MKLPTDLITFTEWVLIGPMGPLLSENLKTLPILAVDGGANFSDDAKIWVGDADSYLKEIKSPHIFRQPIEKDESDLALAFKLFSDFRHYKLHMWGFLGGRSDHELFNIGETLLFLENHQESQAILYREDGKISYQMLGGGHWKFHHQGLFSLGTIKKTQVKLRGQVHYPISQLTTLTPLSSFGLSNIATGEIVLENEGPVFIYYPEGK